MHVEYDPEEVADEEQDDDDDEHDGLPGLLGLLGGGGGAAGPVGHAAPAADHSVDSAKENMNERRLRERFLGKNIILH